MRKLNSDQILPSYNNPRLKIDILTIFPKMFSDYLSSGLVARAIKSGLIEINAHNIRDWAKDKHRTTDDRPYGGGAGMILKIEPIVLALRKLKNKNSFTLLLSPRGTKLNQKKARTLAKNKHLILICGRYEGVDQRVTDRYVDEEVSIGDYIISGGEPAAIVVIDAITRLIPGFLSNNLSLKQESFEKKLLEFPQYTRPNKFEDLEVPEVLLKGNHKEVEEWRKKKSLEITKQIRPDLILMTQHH